MWNRAIHVIPEVYYLHEVCQSCTCPDHGRVLQEQWIWPVRDILFHKLTSNVSKRSSAVWETCERTVSRARTLAFIEHAHCSPPQIGSSLRLRLVYQELVSCGSAYPMMSHGRPGRGSETRNQVCCACVHLEYNAVVWIIAGWHTSCR